MDASGGLLHWHIDAVATMDLVHRFAGVTETWFKSVTVFIAALWLVYRVYLVTIKPVDELVALLGLEVPAQPDVSLAGVKADGVMLHWKPPDWQSLVTKHHVHINGVNVGEVTHRETAVTVYNLKPDHSYTARVVALNSHFQTASEALRFTTLPASSDEFYSEQRDDETTLVDGEEEDATPTLRPSKALFDASSLHLPAAQPMTREHSNSLSQKRAPQARRVSTFVAMNDAGAAHAQEASDSEEAVKDLTSRLEHLRRENDEAERLEKDELDEFESARNALVEERDRYKQQLKEKDDTSRELKKEVTRLERANTSVQGSKNTAERKLQSKHNERRKVKDDIARWESEMEEMKAAVEKLLEQRSTLEKETETRLDAFRDQLAREQDANKSLEEDIREKAMQIKSLEQEKRKMSDGEVETAMQTEDALDEEARQFEDKLRSLQGRYTMAWSTMNQAEAVYSQCQQHLDRLQQRRLSSPQAFASTPTMEAAPLRGASGRRRRQGSIRSDANSPPAAPFGPNGPQFSSSSISSISPTFASGLPFFNYMNGGIQFEPEVAQPAPLSQSQIDALTGGAPMSPSTAGALLPSNLLSDDVDQGAISDIESEMKKENSLPKSTANPQNHRSHTLNDENSSINQQSNRNSAILPGLGAIPGLGAVLASEPASKVPSSPVSADSRSPSVFTSPKESTTHLPHQDIFNEVDRRSLRSNTGSSRGASGTSRFFGGLSLRHRGKASTDEGLTLGSLKTAETQSLPRQDPPEQGAAASRRRGSHSGGGWMGMPSISQAFSRTSKDAEEAGQATNELSKPSRLRPFGMFGKSGDP
ncbi:MAG: fibronectin type III domain-containing protein, partial [Terriglobus roseus]|nr:fibronectin type III domain-containing protein [Terriglobus roseus]